MIAKTIMEQIGGRRFAAMTGSKDFIDMGNGLRMSLARNKTSANRLDIIYDGGADLYNMRFYRKTFSKKTFECRTKDIVENIKSLDPLLYSKLTHQKNIRIK